MDRLTGTLHNLKHVRQAVAAIKAFGAMKWQNRT